MGFYQPTFSHLSRLTSTHFYGEKSIGIPWGWYHMISRVGESCWTMGMWVMANQNLGIPNQNPIFLLVNGCSSQFFDPPKNMDENIGEYFLAPKENIFGERVSSDLRGCNSTFIGCYENCLLRYHQQWSKSEKFTNLTTMGTTTNHNGAIMW